MRIRRQRLCGPRIASELPARVQRGDAHREVAVAHLAEAGRARSCRRRRSWSGKRRIDFDEVLVAGAVAGQRLAERRDDVEGVAVVEPAQARLGHAAELEHQEPAAGARARGRPRPARPRCGSRSGCRRRWCRRRSARRGRAAPSRRRPPSRARRRTACASARRRPSASMSSVMSSTVAWPSPLTRRRKRKAMSPVPPATSSSRMPGPRRQPVEHRVLPEPVDAEAHRVVHQVVARRRPRRRRRAPAPAFSASGTVSKPKWVVGSSAIGRAVFRSFPPLLIRQVGRAATARPREEGRARAARGRDGAPRPRARAGGPASSPRADVRRPDLRWPFPPRLAERLTGRPGDGAAAALEVPARRSRPRRDADRAPRHVRAHPRLRRAGRRASTTRTPAPEKHDHVVLDLEGGARVTFNDARRFGAIDLWPTARARRAPAAGRPRARAARQRLRRRLPRRAPGRAARRRSRRCSSTSGWSRASATSTSARRCGGRGISPLRLARRRDARPRPRRSSPRSARCSRDAIAAGGSSLARLPPGRRRARLLPAFLRGLRPRGRALPALRRRPSPAPCSRAGRASTARPARGRRALAPTAGCVHLSEPATCTRPRRSRARRGARPRSA